MKIIVTNTKGGASKSTVAYQIASAYMLNKGLDFTHYEFDDENLDATIFSKSKIKTEQLPVEMGEGLKERLRDLFWEEENFVIDVGGNKTTTIFLDALKKSYMFKKVDLYIIPSSGGSQDIKNMKTTYDLIKKMDPNAKILFALSRVRSPKRVTYQYTNFFKMFPNAKYIVLKDSDVVDLSRKMQKSILEISKDEEMKKKLEKQLDQAFEKNDKEGMYNYSIMLEIMDESKEFVEEYIKKSFEVIDEVIGK